MEGSQDLVGVLIGISIAYRPLLFELLNGSQIEMFDRFRLDLLSGLLLDKRLSGIILIVGAFLQQLGLILGLDLQDNLLDILAVGTLGLGFVAVKIPI